MSWSGNQSPSYPGKFTIALFGKKTPLKDIIGKILNNENAFVNMLGFLLGENNKFKIINTPDFFDEEYPYPDQQIIDFMALSHPGPHLFILAIDSENTEDEEVVAQISKLQSIFGREFTTHLVVMVPDIKKYQSLQHLKKQFQMKLTITNENLASECTMWCSELQPFLYDYKTYSKDVVMRRKTYLNSRRHDGPPPYHHVRAGANCPSPSTLQYSREETPPGYDIGESNSRASDNIFNFVLLGQTGTGKSASANTILAAGTSQLTSGRFESRPNSMPVTTECTVKMVEKFGTQVRVVDTPDFFHDQLKNPQTQVEECKKYCQPGRFVALLVIQLGRFTEGERGILEKMEAKFGRSIRENTIVLLTHGENVGNVRKFIEERSYLNSIVEKCGNRYHLFSNNSKNPKQVMELIKKIPDYEEIFPKFSEKTHFGQECCLC